MKSLSRALVLALFAASLTLSFASCSFEPDNTDEPATQAPTVSAAFLEGTWESEWNDGFTVNGVLFTSQSNGIEQFSGEIVNVRTLSDANASGYLTLKIKTAVKTNWTEIQPGSYYVVYWKDLAGTSVDEASPYKTGGSNNGMPTQASAEAEYTISNSYFSGTGHYTKK